MQSDHVFLYMLDGDAESERAAAVLTQCGIPFVKVDLLESGALAHIERDLGVATAPFIITSDSTIEGLPGILRFASAAA
jgi:hypothetical protein